MKKFAADAIVPVVDQFTTEEQPDTVEIGRYQGHFTKNGDQGGRLVLTPKPLNEEEKKKVEAGKMDAPRDEVLTMVYNGSGDVITVLHKIGSASPTVHVRNGGKRGTQGNQVLLNIVNGLNMEQALVGTKPRNKKRRSNKPRRSRPAVFTTE